ncbi:MAG: class II aldolase/adducin family protein [Elusimicrobia bacterium]|jgi:L-fuculose-phosphate aldolase|nr:class II aldolase/adducin family protein [Elusimicrobiota bacterium]
MESNFNKFQESGEMLFKSGLVSVTAGNMSMKTGRQIYITATGSCLGFLNRQDILKVDLNTGLKSNPAMGNLRRPSVEIKIHEGIYTATSFKAVAHAHPPTATAISFGKKKIEFVDDEGIFYLPQVPVIKVLQSSIASREVAQKLPSVIRDYGVVMVEGHGAFAAAETLRECAGLLSTLEHSSQILYKKSLFEK